MHINFTVMRRAAFGGLLFFYVMVTFVLSGFAMPHWQLFSVVLFIALAWIFIYLVYFCENYVRYVSIVFAVTMISLLLLACSLPAFAMAEDGTGEQITRKVLAVTPIFSVGFLLLYVISSEPRDMPLIVPGNRIQSLTQKDAQAPTKTSPFFIGGASVSTGSMITGKLDGLIAEAIIVALGTFVLVSIVFICRESLRGLRHLARTSRDLEITYTFYWIDEIRAARRGSYVVRFARWFR
ncbi:hypothetical protein [Pseudomonas massiliensis]|uniref:hypothetical protein n=1 Tax=Pseudomonas massiliensis TaxID=522492 RepID=UPI00058C418B|nr:hypothetical protein [Pseudomonas massiliensis]